MRRLPPLSGLRAFEAAARHGSFRRAADELSVTPTAISHQIRALEDRLGVDLFERRTRQVVLTEAGRRLFPGLRDGFDTIAGALETLAREVSRPALTISATFAFTALWLVPRMARLQATFPQVDLRLHASDDPVTLAAGRADIAIRYGAGPWPGVEAEPMLADRFAPVANPALGIRDPQNLSRAPLIHFDWRRKEPADPDWRMWMAAAGIAVEPPSHLRFSQESHAIQAAVAGQGAALVSLVLVEDEIRAGRLAQPFGPVLAGRTYHLLRASGRRPAIVDAVADCLLAEARGSSASAG